MTGSPRDVRRRELGGPDPLDRQLGAAPRPSPLSWLLSLLRTRSALGLAPSPTPAIIFLPLGALLGPRALRLLSPEALADLDVVVTVGLTVLGMLVGIAFGRARPDGRAAVRGGQPGEPRHDWRRRGRDGVLRRTDRPARSVRRCSRSRWRSVSARRLRRPRRPTRTPSRRRPWARASRISTMCCRSRSRALVLAARRGGRQAWLLALAPIGIGLAVGAIGWLLFDRAESGGERVVFVLGALGAGRRRRGVPERVSARGRAHCGVVLDARRPGAPTRIVEADLGRCSTRSSCCCCSSRARSGCRRRRRCGCSRRISCSVLPERWRAPGRRRGLCRRRSGRPGRVSHAAWRAGNRARAELPSGAAGPGRRHAAVDGGGRAPRPSSCSPSRSLPRWRRGGR